MKTNSILMLTLVLGCARSGLAQPSPTLPPVEMLHPAWSAAGNAWNGKPFREIIPAGQIKHIILLEDRSQNFLKAPPANPKAVQDNFNQLFRQLERSGQPAGNAYLMDNELLCAQFAVVTTSNEVLHLQACGNFSSQPNGFWISRPGQSARINITGFKPTAGATPPANPILPPVEVNYLLNPTPGDWAGQTFRQIIRPEHLRHIFLLEEDMDIVDHFVETPAGREKLLRHYAYDRRLSPPPAIAAAVEQTEHQTGYARLLAGLAASPQTAGPIHLNPNECVRSRLLLFTDTGGIISLEIVTSLQIIGGADSQITGVLLRGPGQGVRINLTVPPLRSEAPAG